MRQNLTEWQVAERIADLPEVHEVLGDFSHDSTADNGVEVVLAVMKAVGTMHKPMTPRMAQLLAEITPEDRHDDNGPGSVDCPACGASMRMQWKAGVRLDSLDDLPHDEDCPAVWARSITTRAGQGADLPWDDCKAAFGFTCDPDPVSKHPDRPAGQGFHGLPHAGRLQPVVDSIIDQIRKLAKPAAQWVAVAERKPEAYLDVVIRLEDGSQRVGRVNQNGDWQLASYQHCKHQYLCNPVAWLEVGPAVEQCLPVVDLSAAEQFKCEFSKVLRSNLEASGYFEKEAFGFFQERVMQYGGDFIDDDATIVAISTKDLAVFVNAHGGSLL